MLRIFNPEQNEDGRREVVIGISAIATHQPSMLLPNAWFESIMAKKFEKHTGICQRAVSTQGEVELALEAIRELEQKSSFDVADCRAILFVTPSSIPQVVARKFLSRDEARKEQPTRMASRFAEMLGTDRCQVVGMNGFCSGYAKAMQCLQRKVLPTIELGARDCVLIVTSSRISRITDFGDRQAGALFGDFATATLLSRADSAKYPMHLQLVDADYEKQAVSRAYFDFSQKSDVLSPAADGGRMHDTEKLVFSLDGMGIADTAPRAMANAAFKMAEKHAIEPDEVESIVPHQAGKAIVRLTGMKLEEAGFVATPINGLTENAGNVSSGSVPFALSENWSSLAGRILCPVAAVGAPGKLEVSQGCIYLRGPQTEAQRKVA